MTDQKANAGNDGDLMKHPVLGKVVDHLSQNTDVFWYVETHTAFPFYFLKQKRGKFSHLLEFTLPSPLRDFLPTAYREREGDSDAGFPCQETYLGSSAQVFQRLKRANKQVRMTLFEKESAPTNELAEYFENEGAVVVVVKPVGDQRILSTCLRKWWNTITDNSKDRDVVLIVQGSSYELAPALWSQDAAAPVKPNLVFIDPFKINDTTSQPISILESLVSASVPTICWTPLNGKTDKGFRGGWTFYEKNGVQEARQFVESCRSLEIACAWFSWRKSTGQGMYGCQLCFSGIINDQLTPAMLWDAPNDSGLAYLSFAKSELGATPDEDDETDRQPGKHWFGKYHAEFWLPKNC